MKNLFFFLLLAVSFSAQSQLNGTYTIGAGNTYTTLSSAITALNTNGISSNVTLLLDQSEVVTAPYILTQYTGSQTYTTTIKPNTGKSISLEVKNVDQNSQIAAAFILNGADRVIIDGNNGVANNNLTIFRNNSNNNFANSVVMLYNSAQYNIFRNFTAKGTTNNSNAFTYGISAGGNTVASAGDNSNNEINTVIFSAMFCPVYVSGTAASSNNNWSILNCTVNAATGARVGIYLNNADSAVISSNLVDSFTSSNDTFSYTGISVSGINASITGNTVTNLNFTTNNGTARAGIQVTGNNPTIASNTIGNITTANVNVSGASVTGSGANIYNNKIYNLSAGGSDRIAAGIAVDGSTPLIYNNMVADVKVPSANNSGGGHGIALTNATSGRVYYNSVRQSGSQGSGRTSALLINSGSSLDIRNNIFVQLTTGGSTWRYAVISLVGASAYSNINYNSYYSVSAVGYLGSGRTSLANWKTATGKDQNSTNINPTFISSTDLHLVDTNVSNLADIAGKAVVISGFALDYDAQERDTTAPDLGADEIGTKCGGTNTTWTGSNWNNGIPTSTSKVTISGPYVTGTQGNINACELQVNGSGTLTISTGTAVVIEYNLKVDGTLTVEDGGSLVQVADDATSQLSGSGQAIVKRKTTPLKQYDYTYWAAPVTGAEVASVTNGGPSIFYTYNEAAGWVWTADNAVLNPGVGFIAMAPENLNYNTPQTVEANFYGNPNTGTINKATAIGYELTGNPYPSPLDADAFLLENKNTITGTIYLWTHNKAMEWQCDGCAGSTYSADDYASYNLTGAVRTSPNGNLPSGKIASGQGFFVKSTASGNIVFKNSMRVKAAGNNSQFFRSANDAPAEETTDATAEVIERNRLWLSLTNDQGAYTQALLGYVTGATNDMDNGFDGELMNGGNFVSLYTLVGNTKLAIQGRDTAFDENTVIPVGFNSTMGGTLTISKEIADGFFSNQNVFLLDKLTNTLTNLQESSYSFTTEVGTFDERFELKFINTTLGTDTPVLDKNDMIVIRNAGQIEVKSVKETIASVIVYDLTGKMISSQDNINDTQFRTSGLNAKAQVVLVQVRTADNREFTSKVLMN